MVQLANNRHAHEKHGDDHHGSQRHGRHQNEPVGRSGGIGDECEEEEYKYFQQKQSGHGMWRIGGFGRQIGEEGTF
jgi:hypothetical protein